MNTQAASASAPGAKLSGHLSATSRSLSDGHPWLRFAPWIGGPALLTAIGYYFGAKFGFALTLPPRPVSVMWPPNAILLAGLLLTPPRAWWVMLLAVLPAHLAVQLESGVPWTMSICWFVSNSGEAAIGAYCTRLLTGGHLRFHLVRHVAAFCLCGGIAGPFFASFIDAAFVRLNHWGAASYWEVWQVRFASNILAAMAITPAIVNAQNLFQAFRRSSIWRRIEGVALFLCLVGASYGVYVHYSAGPGANVALLYASLPFLVWAALRFGTLGSSVAMLTTSLLAIWGAAHGHGPFSTRSPEENAQAMQMFLTLATMVVLMLGATVEERSRAEERFMKAFRLCPDPMLICRRSDGLVIDSNNRWQEAFGFRSLGEEQRTVLDLDIYASNLDQGRLRTSIAERAPFRDLELNLRSRQGEVLQTLASADLAEMSGEPCFIFVLRDLTDRKRAQQATENLAHVSRLAVLGEMTAMIAHEVNQPLGAILNNADAADLLLDKEPVDLGEVRKILADIRKDDVRAGQAIHRVRALLKRKEIQMQPLDLNETAADVIKLLLGEALRKQVIIRSEFDVHLPFVHGDRLHLQQVLLNLLTNGMEAMLDTPISLRNLTVQTFTTNGQVELAVKDAGHGILEENLPRLFDSFFTTKHEGMGLGLAIARSIIEAHQGQIWAENSSGGGAIFRVTLPSMPVSRVLQS